VDDEYKNALVLAFGVEREGIGTHDAPAWFSFWVFSNEILYENAIITSVIVS
jgi:hypothetical protein